MTTAFSVLVLAGERPGGDPLARATGAPRKALIEIEGRTMIERVATAATRLDGGSAVTVCGLGVPDGELPSELRSLASSGTLHLREAAASPATSVHAALRDADPGPPAIVTTADHPLLTTARLQWFADQARECDADLAVALVDGDAVAKRFPGARRTFLPFRGGRYCGSNLFAFLRPASLAAANFWTRVEADRKQPWRIARAFGLRNLAGFVTRRLTLEAAAQRIGERMGLRIAILVSDDPLLAVDVDSAEDLQTVRALLRDEARA